MDKRLVNMLLGLDLSLTGTGICILDLDYKIILSQKLSVSCRDTERLFFLESLFLEIINNYKDQIKLVCIEGPSYGSDKGRIFQIGQWSGIVELHLFKLGLKVITAVPLQVKKYCSGIGKDLGKNTILLDTYKNFGEEFRDDNLADSFILSHICCDYYKKYVDVSTIYEMKIKKYQLEVLEKIHKSEGIKHAKELL